MCGEGINIPPSTAEMNKQLKNLQTLFGKEQNHPTVKMFEMSLNRMNEEEREAQLYALCQLAFGYYERLPRKYQKFISAYFEHNRACYVDYLKEHTPLGALQYDLYRPELFVRMARFVEFTDRRGKRPYLHLASCLSLVFPFSVQLETLSSHLRKMKLTPEDILELSGKLELTNED